MSKIKNSRNMTHLDPKIFHAIRKLSYIELFPTEILKQFLLKHSLIKTAIGGSQTISYYTLTHFKHILLLNVIFQQILFLSKSFILSNVVFCWNLLWKDSFCWWSLWLNDKIKSKNSSNRKGQLSKKNFQLNKTNDGNKIQSKVHF